MATSKDVIKSFTIKVNTENGKVKIDGLTKSYVAADVALDKMTAGLQQNTAALNQQATAANKAGAATGGATAVSLEFGRVISDAPYGIRGVANNITQMASQFSQLVTKVDPATGAAVGFKGAVSAIRTSIMGPLGILLAFTTVIAALDFFGGSLTKAKKSMDDFKSSAAGAGTDLRILLSQVERGNISQQDLAESVRKANEEYEGLNLTLDEHGNLTNESTDAIREQIAVMEQRAFAAALEEEIAERQAKVISTQLKLRKQFSKEDIEATRAMMEADKIAEEQFRASGKNAGVPFYGKIAAGTTEAIMAAYIRDVDRAKEKVNELSDIFGDDEFTNVLFGGKSSGRGKSKQRMAKVFKEKYLDLQKLILKNNQELAKIGIENQVTLIEIEQDTADKELNIKFESYKAQQKLRLDNYLKSIEGTANEQAAAKEARAKFDSTILQAEIDLGEARESIRLNYAAQIAEKEQDIARESYNIMVDDVFDIINRFETDGSDALFDYNEARIQKANEMREKALTANLDAAVEGDDTIAIMEASKALSDFQFQAYQDELDRDKKHYDDKKKIVQEYIGFAKNIGSALGKLAGDNEKMQKAALLVNKGAATADVVVNAQKQIMAARTAHLGRVAAAAGNPIAERASKVKLIADKAKTIIGGAASIANIWATSTSKKNTLGGSGGDGGSGGGRTFDFNLVGSTGVNQAAQTTAGALGQPVQAYVVSGDITNQQQLDNNIQGQASFGEDDD